MNEKKTLKKIKIFERKEHAKEKKDTKEKRCKRKKDAKEKREVNESYLHKSRPDTQGKDHETSIHNAGLKSYCALIVKSIYMIVFGP